MCWTLSLFNLETHLLGKFPFIYFPPISSFCLFLCLLLDRYEIPWVLISYLLSIFPSLCLPYQLEILGVQRVKLATATSSESLFKMNNLRSNTRNTKSQFSFCQFLQVICMYTKIWDALLQNHFQYVLQSLCLIFKFLLLHFIYLSFLFSGYYFLIVFFTCFFFFNKVKLPYLSDDIIRHSEYFPLFLHGLSFSKFL